VIKTLALRWAVLVALLLWQGGGVFFAVVVIPIGRQTLRDQLHRQNVITQRATGVLNRIGVVALALAVVELAWDRSRWRHQRWMLWSVLSIGLVALFPLHARLGELFDPGGTGVRQPGEFYLEHRAYLVVSVVQAVATLAYLGLSLGAWSGTELRPSQTVVPSEAP
jgi:hypothetical protein